MPATYIIIYALKYHISIKEAGNLNYLTCISLNFVMDKVLAKEVEINCIRL